MPLLAVLLLAVLLLAAVHFKETPQIYFYNIPSKVVVVITVAARKLMSSERSSF